MIIGGWQKFSLIDYPGKTCAIIFTRGCNFRCRYCHNPELVMPEKFLPEVPLGSIFRFLKKRQGKLDAVTLTGGEPTEQADLIQLIQKIKQMGFLVKLDSNGSRPKILKTIIDEKLVDYLAMDIKAPLTNYKKIAGWPVPAQDLRQSIKLIMNAGLQYEFRTTLIKSLVSPDDLEKIAQDIRGAKQYFLQKFVPSKMIDEACRHESLYTDGELQKIAVKLQKYVKVCRVR